MNLSDMQPLFDNIEVIKSANLNKNKNGDLVPNQRHRELEGFMESSKVQVTALAYIRGRSFSNTFFIIDESQNLTPHEVKTIITRAGEGTKIIFTGDVHQIDNPWVDKRSNGLTYLIERMRGQPLFGFICLQKGERSELSKLASALL